MMNAASYKVIATGSSGNALQFKDILIDCGVPFKKIEDNVKIENLKYIFLTHKHGDHYKPLTIQKIIETNPSIRVITPEYLADDLGKYIPGKRILKVQANRTYKAGNIVFKVVPLYHDVDNVGYLLNYSGIKVMYATDTNRIDHIQAKGYDYYFVEENYSEDYVNELIEDARINHTYCHQIRSIDTHLSDVKFEEFIKNNAFSDSAVIPMHRSASSFRR